MSILHLLRGELTTKQNDLERLRACKRELKMYQQEFREYERLCLKPHLSAKTWQGKWAKAFDEIRNEGILVDYQNLENKQLNFIITALNEKITKVEMEITSLKGAIQIEIEREREKTKEHT